jgi:hypothetical protein
MAATQLLVWQPFRIGNASDKCYPVFTSVQVSFTNLSINLTCFVYFCSVTSFHEYYKYLMLWPTAYQLFSSNWRMQNILTVYVCRNPHLSSIILHTYEIKPDRRLLDTILHENNDIPSSFCKETALAIPLWMLHQRSGILLNLKFSCPQPLNP